MRHKVLIDSVDLTGSILEPDYEITHSTGGVVNRLTFSLDDPNNNITVALANEVIVEKHDDNTVRFFGGIIADLDYTTKGVGREIKVTCNDWKTLVDRATVTKVYFLKTDKEIIEDAFTEAELTEIDTSTLVQTGRTIDRFDARALSLANLLDSITEITGWIWDIDAFKRLIYREDVLIEGDVGFSDEPDFSLTFPVQNLVRSRSLGAFNAVEIVGAERLGDNTTEVYEANGSRTLFHLYEFDGQELITRAPSTDFDGASVETDRILVQKNTGTEGSPTWTDQSVGLEGQDILLIKDAVWNPVTTRLEFASAPSAFSNAFRVRGRSYGPLRLELEDEAAIDSAGRKFKFTLVEPNIIDEDAALDVAFAFLREQSDQDILTFEFDTVGLEVYPEPATKASFHHNGLGVETSEGNSLLYFITEVVTFIRGGDVIGYQVTLTNHPRLT